MMYQQQVRVPVRRLLHNVIKRVERHQHAPDLFVPAADEQTDVVTLLRRLQRRKGFNVPQNILNCDHTVSLISRMPRSAAE